MKSTGAHYIYHISNGSVVIGIAGHQDSQTSLAMTKTSILVGLVLVCCCSLWAALFYSVLTDSDGLSAIEETKAIIAPLMRGQDRMLDAINDISMERKAYKGERFEDPPPLEEISRNISVYLNTLHHRLGAIAGPKVEAAEIWETFLDVTKNTLIKWDDANSKRFPTPRKDGSIFVSLGTYRDPYCPMTLKSLYAKAKHPDKLFVSLFQQNCFEKSCKTGVLKGGVVEDTVSVSSECVCVCLYKCPDMSVCV